MLLLSPVFFGYRYLGDGGTDRRKILHDGTYVSRVCLLPFREMPQGSPNEKIWAKLWPFDLTANISKTVSRSVTCQLQLNISSTKAF